MKQAVIVDCVRTPIGRSDAQTGYFRHVRSDDLAVACVQALLQRTGIAPSEIEDVVLGCAHQTLEQGLNLARNVALMAGLPVSVGGVTVNRLCGSGLQAIHQAALAIRGGAEDVQIVGGAEHMLHLPIGHGRDLNPRLFRTTSKDALAMGMTAEFLARRYSISRRQQDQLALRSHQRAHAAHEAGQFRREIIAAGGHDPEGRRILLEHDQSVRADTSLEALAALEPVFLAHEGTVTAGNCSPISDGAAALLLMSHQQARQLGLQPLVRVRASAVAGVEPCLMGMGPVPATEKALRRAGLQWHDLQLVELNEAFAAQTLACLHHWGLDEEDEEKLNVRGGAIAIGHPLGASGARIATTLIHAMVDRDAQLGLATMCIGLGQGIAMIFERVDGQEARCG